jgi:NADPH-dependent 2,4-dienoyl-CoA reductase/sulfur reductase-like enzyme/rhodanese-related sulfurtransferase
MKLVIVGGVAGGASAAARARRLNETAEIIIFERGEHISFANCGLPYHIGGVITDRLKLLVQTPETMKKRFNIDVRVKSEVVAINRQQKHVIVRELPTGREYNQPYDKLILSPGAEPIRPNISGINSANVFTLRSIDDMDTIKNVVDKQNAGRAVIIGGGYIGLEMAEMLRRRKLDVSIVELENQVFGVIDIEMASVVASELRLHGVDLQLGTSVTAIEEIGQGLKVQLSSGESLNCTMVIVSIGVRPESKLAKDAGLTTGQRNGIVVDRHMRTSDQDIYAVGDAVEVEDFTTGFATLIPLAGPANRQGRIAADNIMGKSSEYRRTQGTGICKVFDLAVGMTGLNEKMLKRLGREYEKVYIHPASHATYYPGASQMSLKLLYDPKDGKILGAQAVGSDGIDKRIDVLAVSIRAGLTVRDLKDLELAYAPPYGSAKDPINYAGFVASNILDGDVRNCYVEDLLNIGDDKLLLDVRTPGEVETGTIGGAINIPVDQLRSRLKELPKDKELLVFCQVGLRGYVACRILSQNGFLCRNLSGGYKTYRATLNSMEKPACPLQKAELKDDSGSQNITQERKKMV